ncbi:hypothetical protein ACC733_38760, partial [Rhizobium johnstonii]|uniref:hypothetical protein n=1 Tax=Rhizobium johnstonii TaxID=3019933 RepID=UPI003F9537B8
ALEGLPAQIGIGRGADDFIVDFQHVERFGAGHADLSWETFERIVDFVATGGYALRTYERYARIRKTAEGSWRVSNPAV